MTRVNANDTVGRDILRETEAARDLIAALQSDDEILRHDMVEGETSLLEAIALGIAEIDECDVMIAGIKAKVSEFEARQKRAEARMERLRSLMEQALVIAGIPTMKLDVATLSIKELPPKAIVTDEAAIPAEFWKQPDPVLDRAAISKAIKSGQHVPGVVASNKTISMQIRRA